MEDDFANAPHSIHFHNASEHPPPSLNAYKTAASRAPTDCEPAVWYRKMMGAEWDRLGHSYEIAKKRYRRQLADYNAREKERDRKRVREHTQVYNAAQQKEYRQRMKVCRADRMREKEQLFLELLAAAGIADGESFLESAHYTGLLHPRDTEAEMVNCLSCSCSSYLVFLEDADAAASRLPDIGDDNEETAGLFACLGHTKARLRELFYYSRLGQRIPTPPPEAGWTLQGLPPRISKSDAERLQLVFDEWLEVHAPQYLTGEY